MFPALQPTDTVLTGPNNELVRQIVFAANPATPVITWPHRTQVPLNQLPLTAILLTGPFSQPAVGVPQPILTIAPISNVVTPGDADVSAQVTVTATVNAGTMQAVLYVGGTQQGTFTTGPGTWTFTVPVGNGNWVRVRSQQLPVNYADSNQFNVTNPPPPLERDPEHLPS